MKKGIVFGLAMFVLGLALGPRPTVAQKPQLEMSGLCQRYELFAAHHARMARANGKREAAEAVEAMRDMFCFQVAMPKRLGPMPE